MNEPARLRDTGGAARVLLGAGKLEVPPASRQRALAFTGVAASVATTGTAVAASATALVKSVVLCVCLGTVGGGVASLAISETVARVEAAHTEAKPTPAAKRSSSTSTAARLAPEPPSGPVVISAAPVVAPPAAVERGAMSEGRASGASSAQSGSAVASSAPSGSRKLQPGSSLVDEQRVIESARAAVARGDSGGALTVLDSYERSYAQGQFGPEALALRIEALSGKGELTRARNLAAEFRQRYPHHPLLARVQTAVQTSASGKR